LTEQFLTSNQKQNAAKLNFGILYFSTHFKLIGITFSHTLNPCRSVVLPDLHRQGRQVSCAPSVRLPSINQSAFTISSIRAGRSAGTPPAR